LKITNKMEELALKPDGKTSISSSGYQALQTNYLTEYKTIYVYGSNIADWALIEPLTSINHSTLYPITSIFDDNNADYFYMDTNNSDVTSTITLNYGKLLEVRQIQLLFSMQNDNAANTQTLTLEVSEDGINFTILNTFTAAGALAETYYQFLPIVRKVRTIRLTYFTGGALFNQYIKLFNLKLLV